MENGEKINSMSSMRKFGFQNGKCILAGLTLNNVRLLREKYEEVKLSVAASEQEVVINAVD